MVRQFSKAQFEAALPEGRWKEAGLIQGEYCYTVQVKENVRIFIRSSVDVTGVSAETGGDSIRTWLQDDEGNFIGSKLTRWITRQNGWEERLVENLRNMWRIGNKLGKCQCGAQFKAFKSKKEGPRQGWIFRKCDGCGKFDWLGEY